MVSLRYALFAILVSVLSVAAVAQDASTASPGGPCAMPANYSAESGKNLFSEQQEQWLGEIMDAGMRKSFHVIDDPDAYLQRIGERLLAQLPPTRIQYRFVIVDSPGLNSFGLTGGRIYIYRRMIAFAKSEDELAALLGHEIGHMIMHQEAIDVSDWFRQLGITSVSDRQDIFNKWNQLEDNTHKLKRKQDDSHEQQEQLIADRIGLYAVIRAGYDPAQFASFADRSFETKGKTGGFWSDLFGATTPESKRLREILRNAKPLPPTCIAPRPDTSRFAKWQQAMVEAKLGVAGEQLPGLKRKVSLQPPLRNDLNFLQFSPDGNFLLAQDDSSIFLLTREPLANLFRIDAPQAKRAQFTPDSKSVVFYDKELRVEKWDLSSQKPAFVYALSANCKSTELSPVGNVMACVRPDQELQLIDVSNGQVIFSRKKFFELTAFDILLAELMQILREDAEEPIDFFRPNMGFSTDGRYFIADFRDYAFAYDLSTRSELKIPGKLKPVIRSSFVFTGPDEIFGVDGERSQKAFRIRFPGGEIIDQFPFPGTVRFFAAVKSNYVLVRPAGIATIGAIDLSAKKTTMGYKTDGFAIFDKILAGDDVDGQLKLYRLPEQSQIGQIQLPNSPLARAKASVFSANGKWLAVSGRTRGASWALDSGKRVGFSGDFDGAFFDQDRLLAKFPKNLKDPAQMVAVTPVPLTATKLYELDSHGEGDDASLSAANKGSVVQFEDLLFRIAPADAKKPGKYDFEVRDVLTNSPLWQIQFEKHRPRFFYLKPGETVSFLLSDYDSIKQAAQQDPALNAKLSKIDRHARESLYMVEVFAARTHRSVGSVLVDTGNLSFRVLGAGAAGDTVIVSDSENRTLVYSLKSGDQLGKVFGKVVALSNDGKKMLVENGPGIADLYDATTLQATGHFTFPSRIARAEFLQPDSMSVLTADQTVYEFELETQKQKASIP
jgi:hypothetical protein